MKNIVEILNIEPLTHDVKLYKVNTLVVSFN
jgi:hypothetical protein